MYTPPSGAIVMSLALPERSVHAVPEYFQIWPPEFTTQGFPVGSTAILTPAPLMGSHALLRSRMIRWSDAMIHTAPFPPTAMSIAFTAGA
jgi:hypothetical protein